MKTKRRESGEVRRTLSHFLALLSFLTPLAVIILALLLGHDIYNRYLATFYHRQCDILNEKLSTSNPSLTRQETILQQIQLLQKAISLDPNNAICYNALGLLYERIASDPQLLISLQFSGKISRQKYSSVFQSAEDNKLLTPPDLLLLALNEYQNAIQTAPINATYHLKLGRLYTKLIAYGNKFASDSSGQRGLQPNNSENNVPPFALPQTKIKAEAELEKSLALEPETPELHFKAGNYLLETGNLPKSLKVYGETLNLDVNYLDRIFEQLENAGVPVAKLGDTLDEQFGLTSASHAKQAEIVGHSITSKPDIKITFINKLISRGDYKPAEKFLRKWIESNSSSTDDSNSRTSISDWQLKLHQLLASLYERQRKYNAAITELKFILVVNPKDTNSRLHLISILERKGDSASTKESESLCREAIKMGLDGFTFHSRLAQLLSNKKKLRRLKSANLVKSRLDEAEYHYRQAIQLMPNNINYRLTFADWLSKNKRTNLAIEELKTILAICQRPSQRAQAHIRLGNFYDAEKSYAKALKHFKAATELEPNNASHFYRLGQFYEKTGSIESAIDAFEKAYKLSPSNSQIKSAREKAYKHRERLRQILLEKSKTGM